MERILNEQKSLLSEARGAEGLRLRPENLVSALGVVYAHLKSDDGGDLYLTRFGLRHARHLAIRNWYERNWFRRNRQRLVGTSCVYRVPTRPVDGRSLELVVKNCRVGEDVPLDTHTLEEFVNAEFNSPWEEFALVMEMREGAYGPPGISIRTQAPLAIYVPSERMQKWQTGRSRSRINRIRARHPGISLDILRQYKLVYGWIHGMDLVEAFAAFGVPEDERAESLASLTRKAIADMAAKGYVVADMKPQHIILDTEALRELRRPRDGGPPVDARRARSALEDLVRKGRYAVVDYELLLRTEEHQGKVHRSRRHSYLDCQRTRFVPGTVPLHLKAVEIMDVPYIFGHVESTGGRLWVVGKNARLFDYFLPERWRRTPSLRLSGQNDVRYTLTKDNIHIVWKTSRVGERYPGDPEDPRVRLARERGFNSPFEESALARTLSAAGLPTVHLRAVYMTGTRKIERSEDRRRYALHRRLRDPLGAPILRARHNYITLWGYFNGPDDWVAEHEGELLRPLDLARALREGKWSEAECRERLEEVVERLAGLGFDGRLLTLNDLLIAEHPDGRLFKGADGRPEVRICSLDLIAGLRSGSLPRPGT